jgi:2,3-bisphosphoglycerate-independent phosphoglycerate mutase
MHILLLFLDGIGLGADDPAVNPFAAADTPTLTALAGGRKWLRDTPRTETARAVFIPTDPRLGVPGRPQSGTGQAAIMTGRNIPAEIGKHYGPWPDEATRTILSESSLYKRLVTAGKTGAYLAAYPPGYHAGIQSGKRLGTSLQNAAFAGGVSIPTDEDLRAGRAFSADFTGQGWRDVLGYSDTPVYTPEQAGAQIAAASRRYDFAMLTTWITDEIGHKGPFERGVQYLELFDKVMAGLLNAWDDDEGLIVITSDHGNLEDRSHRFHTENDVPTVVIGARRGEFAEGFTALIDITPKVLRLLGVE